MHPARNLDVAICAQTAPDDTRKCIKRWCNQFKVTGSAEERKSTVRPGSLRKSLILFARRSQAPVGSALLVYVFRAGSPSSLCLHSASEEIAVGPQVLKAAEGNASSPNSLCIEG
jgi:hypothetical protein